MAATSSTTPPDELTYWTAYAQGQWATAAGSVGRGKPFMYVQASDAATRDAYNKAGVFSFLSAQVGLRDGLRVGCVPRYGTPVPGGSVTATCRYAPLPPDM